MLKKLVSGAACLALAACGTTSESAVRVGFALEPTGLDPTVTAGVALDQVLNDNVYEGLVARTEDGDIIPRLATSWQVSDDGLTYVFTLATDVTFHDGTQFGPEDVVASLQAASAPDSTNPDARFLASIAAVEETGPHEVTITLRERNIDFLAGLTTKAGFIIPSDNDTNLARHSNGTGPYEISSWNTGVSISLSRFDDYWGQVPDVESVIYQYYPDAITAANALDAGELDILTFTTPEVIERFENLEGFQITEGEEPSTMILAFNNADEDLSDPRVRHAIRMGIDKDGLISALGNIYTRIGGPVTPAYDWWDPSLVDLDPYDPDAARALLEEAGATDLSLNVRIPSHYDQAIAEYIAIQLADIGIDVHIDTIDFATWLTEVYAGAAYDMTVILHVEDNTIFNYGREGYYWNYHNSEVSSLMAQASNARSDEERTAVMTEVARLLSEDAAADWLYSPGSQVIARSGLSGFPVDRVLAHFSLRNVEQAP